MTWTPKQTVLVPVDFSEASFAAVEVGKQIVAEPSGLHVVHVIPKPSLLQPVAVLEALEPPSQHYQSVEEQIRQHLRDNYPDAQINVFFGDPGTEISAFAERVNADLIVIPTHGRTGLKRILLGSVAERVIELAHCPVLVLRR